MGSANTQATAGYDNSSIKTVKTGFGAPSATAGGSDNASRTATASSGDSVTTSSGGVKDASNTASAALLSFSASLSSVTGSIAGSFSSLDSAATSAASALEQLAASAQVQSVPTASTPVAMPTPEAMGAVNPSVLGASSLESGGGSTTNTTNNFYMDNVQASQNVNTDQIARAVQTLMDSEDAWRKMYLGPWR